MASTGAVNQRRQNLIERLRTLFEPRPWWMNGLMLFGNGLAPVMANHIYDVTRSYDIVLWAQIPACLGTALLFLTLGPYPGFARAAGPAPTPA